MVRKSSSQLYVLSSSSDTTTSSGNSDSALKKFNRLLRSSVARHWTYFKRNKQLRVRGRSVSDAGLCSILDHVPELAYLDIPPRGVLGTRSTSALDKYHLHAPTFSITSAGGGSHIGLDEASDGSDVERPRRNHLRVPTPAFVGQSMEIIGGKSSPCSKSKEVTILYEEKANVDSKITEVGTVKTIAEDVIPDFKNTIEIKDENLCDKDIIIDNDDQLSLQAELDVIDKNRPAPHTSEGKNATVEGKIENNNCSKRRLLKCGNNNSISKCKGVKFDEKHVTSTSAVKLDTKDVKSESKDVKQEYRDIPTYNNIPISGKLLRWSIRRDSLPLVSIRNVLLKKRNLSPDNSSWRRRSTGNFAAGSAGGGREVPRSAPATPLQLEPTTPRSKHDKQAIKPLSGSAVSVRANGTGDAAEGKQPSKSRQKKFQRHFPQVGPEEKVLNYYSCALVGDLLLQGHLYITKNYFAFYSNVFGYVTKLLIPTTSVLRITKEKVARIIPNAVGVCTRDERHVFGSLLSRDSTYKLMTHVWKAARAPPELIPPTIKSQDLRASEVELDASEYSPEDDSSSAGDRLDAPDPPATRTQTDTLIGTGKVGVSAVIQPALLTGSTPPPLKQSSTPYNALLISFGVLLALSASWMCYKLYHTSHHPLQEDLSKLSGSELYSELVRFRARLHGRAANELHTFLTSNLLLLTKVRQSLEALSGVILSDMAHEVPADTVFS